MENQNLKLSVGDFLALTNQILDGAYPSVEIEGEVASFKVNQGKYVFFDLKDSEGTVGCFMMLFALRIPIEDGMKVVIRATAKLTKWGRFSLTVSQVRPIGEGSLKKGIALLREKLTKEGLFDEARKRPLPTMPRHIAVISSVDAAGYADFMKIINERWGGMQVDVAHVQVQGEVAADQMIRALKYLNTQQVLPEVIILIRGGGSADDLASFNDELLVREVVASRVPVLTGIGHEVDESLVDLAADVCASTPSNAAELLTPDVKDISDSLRQSMSRVLLSMDASIATIEREQSTLVSRMIASIDADIQHKEAQLGFVTEIMNAFHPGQVLERGYALVRGKVLIGEVIEVETAKNVIKAEVQDVRAK